MLKFMLDGGPLMWVLLALSITGLAVILERWRVLATASRDTSLLRRMVLQLLAERKVDEAIRLCEETKGPVAAILLAGLNRYRALMALRRQKAEIEASVSKCMEDYAPHVLAELEKRVGLLLLVGSTAPLVGMTGTVTGMIKAFNEMAKAGGTLQGGDVAAGISEALITTAAGLLIAVPAVIAYNLFVNRVEQLTIAIEDSANELVNFLHLRD